MHLWVIFCNLFIVPMEFIMSILSYADWLLRKHSLLRLTLFRSVRRRGSHDSKFIASPFPKGRGWRGNVNIVGRKLPKRKKHPKWMLLFYADWLLRKHSLLCLTPFRSARRRGSHDSKFIASPFPKGRGWTWNVNIVGRKLPKRKKHPKWMLFVVGVDGFEPPTLCL